MFFSHHPTHVSFSFLQAQKPSMHNINGLFRIIVTLDSGASKLLGEDIIKLIAGYLVDASLVCTCPYLRSLALW
jgi:hypothetical protein